MRIFIALLFEPEKQNIIYDMLSEVKAITKSGRFTSYDNLHLTLLYLGETSKDMVEKIYHALKALTVKSFTYETNHIKYFHKNGGKLITYLGVEKTYPLQRLYQQVRVRLENIGLDFPTRKYTPHITLGRKVTVKEGYSLHDIYCNKLQLTASKISIMESLREHDKLVYKERYHIPLNS